MTNINHDIWEIVSPGMSMLLAELISQGVVIKLIPKTPIIELQYRGQIKHIVKSFTPLIPYQLGIILNNKTWVKELLAKNCIPNSKGLTFGNIEKRKAYRFAESLGFPIFMRVENANLTVKGIGQISNQADFYKAWDSLAIYNSPILVEPTFEGNEYLVTIDRLGRIQTLQKRPLIDSSTLISDQQIVKDKIQTFNRGFNQISSVDEFKNPTVKDCRQIKTNQAIYECVDLKTTPVIMETASTILNLVKPIPIISIKFLAKSLTTNDLIVTDIYHWSGISMFFPFTLQGKEFSLGSEVYAEWLLK